MSATAQKTLRTPSDIVDAQLAGRDRLATLEQVAARYTVAITPALADLIDPSDPHDPMARQFVPDAREPHMAPEESHDPIGDEAHSPVEGIVHRYPDRVLLGSPSMPGAVDCRLRFGARWAPGRRGLRPPRSTRRSLTSKTIRKSGKSF